MYRKTQTKDIRPSSARENVWESEAAATLPGRIGCSASGLLKETFELPSPRAAIGVLASINDNNTKSGPSSSSKGANESSLAFKSSSRYAKSTLDQGEAFRSNEKGETSGRTSGQLAFDDFLEEPNELEHEPDSVQERSSLIDDKQGVFAVGAADDDLHQVQGRETWKRQDGNTYLGNENSDGAAVVDLLSEPGFVVDDEPSSTLDSETTEAEGQSYKRLQTGKGLAESVSLLHPPSRLGLIPDFGAPWSLSRAFLANHNCFDEENHLRKSGFGEVQPWIDILDRYHDEVWGERLPLVQEAGEELAAANEKQTCSRYSPAIRRLAMVLKHLNNSQNG